MCLNAPFGARCFLTLSTSTKPAPRAWSLNAPFGARCFLTRVGRSMIDVGAAVLMRLLVLGAF